MSLLTPTPAPHVTRKSTCGHRLWNDPAGLRCTRDADHHDGCVYTDGRGSAVPDRHSEPVDQDF